DPPVDKVLDGPNHKQWLESIKTELDQIDKMHTFDITTVDAKKPPNIIGSHIVL
ncbi:hypothetical protein BDQ12DRAFT_569204, partial [Crucibulum laeve]